jgi:propanol-preferring alcohol dehydrogenase
MRAMVLKTEGGPLERADLPVPVPGPRQVVVRVEACGVCRTDLHVVDGDLKNPKLPLVPGHEIAGIVEETGEEARLLKRGDRVGIPWLGGTCGECRFCAKGAENLCERPVFTGYTVDGGYAEFAAADERFCFPLPYGYTFTEAAPLLCAGLIGYRSYAMTGEARHLGIYGFGAAAHIITQVAVRGGRTVYAFTKTGDAGGKDFAKRLGAAWAGDSTEPPPRPLEAAIIFAPVGSLVPAALRAVEKGGVVVCAGIHMSAIPGFPYELLWGERVLRSVANLTRKDGEEFMAAAATARIRTEVTAYPLLEANEALDAVRGGKLDGAAVLTTGGG